MTLTVKIPKGLPLKQGTELQMGSSGFKARVEKAVPVMGGTEIVVLACAKPFKGFVANEETSATLSPGDGSSDPRRLRLGGITHIPQPKTLPSETQFVSARSLFYYFYNETKKQHATV